MTFKQTFVSTSKRTVGVLLDLDYGKVSFWLNGRMHKKNKDITLKKTGLTWYPYLRLTKAGCKVYANPFCQMPTSDIFGGRVRKDNAHVLIKQKEPIIISYVADKIGPKILLANLPK